MKVSWIARICCALCCSGFFTYAADAVRIRTLYVEPFTTRAGMEEKLRARVVAELHKNSIAIAASPSGADAILGGGGEVWVKAYRSLNPRSGRQPSNGDPVYAGYLTVEL